MRILAEEPAGEYKEQSATVHTTAARAKPGLNGQTNASIHITSSPGSTKRKTRRIRLENFIIKWANGTWYFSKLTLVQGLIDNIRARAVKLPVIIKKKYFRERETRIKWFRRAQKNQPMYAKEYPQKNSVGESYHHMILKVKLAITHNFEYYLASFK